MLDRIFKRESPANVLGFFMVALLISAASVHPQTPSPSDAASGSAMQSGQTQSGTMNQSSQGGKQSSGSSSASNASGAATGASNTAAAPGATGTAVSVADRNLMRELAYANLSEIALAKLAQSKASSDEVRNFAQRMIDDHGKAMDQLQQLAQKNDVQLPTTPDAKHQALEKKLSALSGEAFDREYMDAGMVDHRNTHSLVARISASARDPDLKALAMNIMPAIDQHLQMAQQLGAKAGRTSSGK